MITAFNPDNLPGRLGVVVRMGARKLRENLPNLIAAVQRSGQVIPAHRQKASCTHRNYNAVLGDVLFIFSECGLQR